MMTNRPKYSGKQEYSQFNTKEYVFQIGNYFANNLQNIQDKIKHLRLMCKETTDKETEYEVQVDVQQEQAAKAAVDAAKVNSIKNQAEIRKLTESCHKMEESIKIYEIQIKHLTSKVSELDQENHSLKQTAFL